MFLHFFELIIGPDPVTPPVLFSHGKGEEGVGVGLILQREVPNSIAWCSNAAIHVDG